jgi:hypothetical protein
MAALETKWPTLLDVAKATDPDGNIAMVAEILNETNEILDDMVWLEGNLATGHRTTVRTGIPAPTWRRLYGGVQPTKSTRAQITDSCGMLEAYAEIDKALADLNGNTAAFRLSEDQAHVEGMSQEMATALFTADDSLESEKFTGLNARYNDLSAENGDNIIQESGISGSDAASIWLIGWGGNTCHGIYPKGSTAGLHQKDLGEVTVENVDGSNGRMQAYRSHYRWDVGLTLRDWRYVVRVQVDRSALTSDAASGANLPELMFEATERVPNLSGARFSWYMDRNVRTKLRQQVAAGVSNSTLTVEMLGGKRIVMFDEIPIRRVDALQVDEAVVS